MVLLTVVVLFLCVGILTPKEMLEGFSNKGMITVGMLFLVSEGIRQSGALGQLIKKLLPEGKTTVFKAQLRMLPPVAFVSAFLNNTPVVVIFAPIIKRWAESVKLPATKFLIPLSYVTILGGICTLIGTSTNLVVHGMILDAGYEGFTMFELGRVGIFIALAGIIYLFVFSNKLLPDSRTDRYEEEEEDGNPGNLHRVEAVLGSRFPGINKTLGEFNFTRHYGAIVKEVKSGGQRFTRDLDKVTLHEGDTLVLWADDTFVPTWGESSVFLLLANGKDGTEPVSRKKRWLALGLLIFMIVGATIGELPVVKEAFPEIRLDMFFFVCIYDHHHGVDQDFPSEKVYQIYILGYSDYDCLCLCHQQGDGEFRFRSFDSPSYYRYVQQHGTVCFTGDSLYHHQYLYGTDYEQCGCGAQFPDCLVGRYAARCGPDAVLRGDLYGGICQFQYADRLSDQSDRARYR